MVRKAYTAEQITNKLRERRPPCAISARLYVQISWEAEFVFDEGVNCCIVDTPLL